MDSIQLDQINDLVLYRRDDEVHYSPTAEFIRDSTLIRSVSPEVLVKIAMMAGAEMANYSNKSQLRNSRNEEILAGFRSLIRQIKKLISTGSLKFVRIISPKTNLTK